jgi:Eukaryotic-type carbonic anhydrase
MRTWKVTSFTPTPRLTSPSSASFYRIGPRPNRLLETILRNAPEPSGEEAELHSEANPADLFKGVDGLRTKRGRVHVDSFYAYAGSLTSPGCTENVRWSVLSDGGHVSSAAVSRFHGVIADFDGYNGYRNNNRPVQPLNGAWSSFAAAPTAITKSKGAPCPTSPFSLRRRLRRDRGCGGRLRGGVRPARPGSDRDLRLGGDPQGG